MYEQAKEFVVYTACGMFLALDLFGIWYTVSSVAGWLKKKIRGQVTDRTE